MELLAVINPHARYFSDDMARYVESSLARTGRSLAVVTESLEEVDEIVRQYGPAQTLVNIGGDGGNHTLLSAQWRHHRKLPEHFAAVPRGTVNVLADQTGSYDGVLDRMRRILDRNNFSVIGVEKARRLIDNISYGLDEGFEDVPYEELPALRVNNGIDHIGFFASIGTTPRLLFTYEGRDEADYRSLLDLIEKTPIDSLEEAFEEKKRGLERKGDYGHVLRAGFEAICGAVLTSLGVRPHNFHVQEIPGRVYLDSQNVWCSGSREDGQATLNDIVAVSYPAVPLLGIPGIRGTIHPHARDERGMPIALGYQSPLDIVMDIPSIFSGGGIRNVRYVHGEHLRYMPWEDGVLQIEGEILPIKNGTPIDIEHERDIKVIAPFKKKPRLLNA